MVFNMNIIISNLFILFMFQFLIAQTPGTMKWKFDTTEPVISSPAIGNNNTIYFGSWDSNIYAVNYDGTLKWSFTTGGRIVSSASIGPDGTIYIGSRDNKLYALDDSGNKKWDIQFNNLIPTTPAIDLNGNIYIAPYDNYLYAIDPDGSILWNYKTNSRIYSSPIIGQDNTIYFTTYNANLYSLDMLGNLKWISDLINRNSHIIDVHSYGVPSLSIDKYGTIYSYANDAIGYYNHHLFAVNPNGKIKWRYDVSLDAIFTTPAVDLNDNLFFGSVNRRLYSLRPNRTQNWYDQTGKMYGTPAIDNIGKIYIGTHVRGLISYYNNGNKAWTILEPLYFSSSPSIDSTGILYVGANDGLYAIYTGSNGLSNSVWPKYRKDLRNTGNSYNVNTPVAIITTDTINCNLGETVTLDASQSYDPDNEPLNFHWRLANGEINNDIFITDTLSSVTNLTVNTYGIYKIILTITDNDDGAATKVVVVNAGTKLLNQFDSDISSKIIISDDGTLIFACRDFSLNAIDSLGKKLWSVNLDDWIYSPIIGPGNMIYAGSGNRLCAVSMDGNLQWTYNTAENLLIYPCTDMDSIIYLPEGKNFHAINKSGNLKWTYQLDDWVTGAPIIGIDGTIYLEDLSNLYAIRPNGILKWTFSRPVHSHTTQIITDRKGNIYVNYDNDFYIIGPDGYVNNIFSGNEFSFYQGKPIISSDNKLIMFAENSFSKIDLNNYQRYSIETGSYNCLYPFIDNNHIVYTGLQSYSEYRFKSFDNLGTQLWTLNIAEEQIKNSNLYYTINKNGVIYIAGNNKIYSLKSENIQLDDSYWPKFRRDLKNSGNGFDPNCPKAVLSKPVFYSAINQNIFLDGSQSFDPDGDPLFYTWSCLEKPAGSVISLLDSTSNISQLMLDTSGKYKFKLTVTDNEDGTSVELFDVYCGIKQTIDLYGPLLTCPAINIDSSVYYYNGNYLSRRYPEKDTGLNIILNNTGFSPVIDDNNDLYYTDGPNLYYRRFIDESTINIYTISRKFTNSLSIGKDNNINFATEDSSASEYFFYSLKKNGILNWKINFKNRINSKASIGKDGTIYIAPDGNNLFALNSNGDQKWKYISRYPLKFSPVISEDGTIFFAAGDSIIALKNNGKKKWDVNVGGYISITPLIGNDNNIYVGTENNKFYSINKFGSINWTINLVSGLNISPVIGSDSIIYIFSGNKLYAVNADGSIKYDLYIGENLSGTPTINYDGSLYIGSNDKMYVIQTSSMGINNDVWPKYGNNLSNSGSIFNPNCPVAIITDRTLNVEIDSPFALDGSNSFDADNDVLTYLWKCIEKPLGSSYIIDNFLNSTTSVSVNKKGSYKFSLEVSDNEDGQSVEIIEVHCGFDVNLLKTFGHSISSQVLRNDGTLVFITDKNIHAFEQDGSKIWSTTTNQAISSIPSIDQDGTLYFSTTYPSNLNAIDKDGNYLWSYYMSNSGNTSSAINKNYLIQCSNNNLTAINKDGEFLLDINISGLYDSSPIIGPDKRIYVGSSNYKLYSINESGMIQWQYSTNGEIYSTPACSFSGIIYMGSNDGFLYAINTKGIEEWKIDIGGNLLMSPLTDEENNIYIGSTNNNFYSVSEEGKINWIFNSKGSINFTGVVGSDSIIYFGSDDNYLYAVNKNGSLIWKYKLEGKINTNLLLSPGGIIYVGTSEGNLYALQTTSKGLAESSWPSFQGTNQNTGFPYVGYSSKKWRLKYPSQFHLHQNYPNPFNSITTIEYDVAKTDFISISIYNALGQEVKKLVNKKQNNGHYVEKWDATNNNNAKVSSGIYFCVMTAKNYTKINKMLLIK